MFGWKGTLTADQSASISSMKQVIYDGFRVAIARGIPKDKAGILVDEQFGAGILRDAVGHGYMTACTAEKSGRSEFDFEYGDEFATHIEAFKPTFCKVLVRYNPENDSDLNGRQAIRLRRLSDYLHDKSSSRFMFELLVPPLETQLDRVNRDKSAWESEIRPRLMVQAIEELQEAQVEPDVWKIEGLERRDDYQRVVDATRRNGRNAVGCIILGRGEDEAKVRTWLRMAASVPGFIGFAVGRTAFWRPLTDLQARRIRREEAVAAIASRYREFAEIFEHKAVAA